MREIRCRCSITKEELVVVQAALRCLDQWLIMMGMSTLGGKNRIMGMRHGLSAVFHYPALGWFFWYFDKKNGLLFSSEDREDVMYDWKRIFSHIEAHPTESEIMFIKENN